MLEQALPIGSDRPGSTQIPHADRLVCTGRKESIAVGGKQRGSDRAEMEIEPRLAAASGGLPEVTDTVVVAGKRPLSIRGERDGVDGYFVPSEGVQDLAGFGVPEECVLARRNALGRNRLHLI